MKKKIGAIVGSLLALIVMVWPIEGLYLEARAALAVLAWAIVWWVCQVVPDYITAMLMGLLFCTLSKSPMSTVCSAFSGSTWWLLLCAFGLSLGIGRCGLIKRLALWLLRLFPRSYMGQCLALTAIGFVSAPFIPSLSAKSSMLAPLAMAVSDRLGNERKGKQATGLFLAMLTGLRTPALLFISASPIGYALLASYPEEIRSQSTMGRWFIAALPWGIMVTAGTLAALYLLYRPKGKEHSAAAKGSCELPQLPPMTKDEKLMAVIISAALIMWVTESFHGIPAHLVAMAALCLTIAFDILPTKEFCTGMNWDSLIFIGFALGIAPVFHELGIDQWIVDLFMPLLSCISSAPLLFLLCTALITVLLRFVIVSEMAYINIVLVFLLPLAQGLGINPWVVGLTAYAVISPWFFLYQNPVYMAAFHSVRGEMVSHSKASAFCPVYLLICTAAILLSVNYWLKIGIFYV